MNKKEENKKINKEPLKKNTGAFGGKPYLKREEVRGWLRRPEAFKFTKLPERERVKLEKDLFGSEYGFYIEKGEPEKVLKKLEEKKAKAATGAEKSAIDKKIKLLRNFLGR